MYKIISDLKFLFPKLNILFTETIQKFLDKEQQQHFKKDSELDSLIIGLKQKQRFLIQKQRKDPILFFAKKYIQTNDSIILTEMLYFLELTSDCFFYEVDIDQQDEHKFLFLYEQNFLNSWKLDLEMYCLLQKYCDLKQKIYNKDMFEFKKEEHFLIKSLMDLEQKKFKEEIENLNLDVNQKLFMEKVNNFNQIRCKKMLNNTFINKITYYIINKIKYYFIWIFRRIAFEKKDREYLWNSQLHSIMLLQNKIEYLFKISEIKCDFNWKFFEERFNYIFSIEDPYIEALFYYKGINYITDDPMPFILAQKCSSFLKKWLYFPYKNEFLTQRYKVLLTFYMNNLVCFDNLDKNRPLTLEENIWVQKVSEFEALLEKEKINY